MKDSIWFRQVPWRLLLAVLCLLTAAPQPALAQDEPTIAKDSVLVTVQKAHGGIYGWVPEIKFTINGPMPSGSVPWVEFGFAGKKQWLKLECEAGRGTKGRPEAECHVGDREKEKYQVIFTGLVDFAIHLRNELQQSNTTLFRGKMKVGKYPHPKNPKQEYVTYYVDEDWRIPIGYLYVGEDRLNLEFWWRDNLDEAKAYLFHQGKEVDQNTPCVGSLVGVASQTWGRAECIFRHSSPDDLKKKPGEYEIKVMRDERLARSVKFTVNADGSFDNGIAAANQLGSNRVIVPVKVIGDQDGVWDKLAWKTGAFYGNPLTGFTWVP